MAVRLTCSFKYGKIPIAIFIKGNEQMSDSKPDKKLTSRDLQALETKNKIASFWTMHEDNSQISVVDNS